MSKRDWAVACAFAGGSFGAAGWILGIAEELLYAPAGAVSLLDVVIVLLCAGGVVLTGAFLWYFYLSGRRLSNFVVLETLVGASLVFGMLAIWWMDARGVLDFVTTRADQSQPGVELLYRIIPPRKEYAYAVPLVILALMAAACWPPLQRWMFAGHTHIQRDKSEYGRPGQLSV